MAGKVKAIETVYGGFRFRSRTEARWAVFFDQAGIEYQYEPEGFSGNGWSYLPDFYVPRWGCYVEVKPLDVSPEEIKKCLTFSIESGSSIVVILGTPADRFRWFIMNRKRSVPWDVFCKAMREDGGPPPGANLAIDCLVNNGTEVYFAECLVTGHPVLVPSNSHRLNYRLATAAKYAQQSRFEFGETPAKPDRGGRRQ